MLTLQVRLSTTNFFRDAEKLKYFKITLKKQNSCIFYQIPTTNIHFIKFKCNLSKRKMYPFFKYPL